MQALRVLFIEDTEDDVELIVRELERAGFRIEPRLAETLAEIETALGEPTDFIISDFNLPGITGLEALNLAKKVAPQIPFIVVSGAIGEEKAVALMRGGAKDFVSKSNLSKLGPVVRRELNEAEHVRRLALMEQQLGEAQENFKLMVESLRDYAIIMIDTEGRIASWNIGAQRIFGYTDDEILGKHFSLFFTEPDLALGVDRLKLQRLEQEGQITEDLWHLRKNGDRFWGSGFMAKLVDPSGKVRGYTKILRDNTDRKQAEEAIHEAKLKAEAANRAKTQFLANMSHEIRTPLGAILGFTELALTSAHNQADLMNCLYSVQRNGRQLMRLIDDLLDMTKVEAGRVEVECIDVDLPEVLQEIEGAFAHRADTKGVRFSVDLETPIPRSLRSDPTRIKQVLMNLVGNALKFTDSGIVKLRVRASETGGQTRLVFRVQDTGIGIANEHVARLFRPFTQAEASTTRRFGGTGLGLAISHKLAQVLGGELSLEWTALGKGSIFSFSLPIRPDSKVPLIDRLMPSQSLDQAAAAAGDARLAGLRVLLVEDSPDNQVLISRFIRGAQGHVDIAANGLQAVEMATRGDYEVVLMDIQMPQLNGYQAAARLRSLGYKKPVIALTAYALPDERMRCLEAGCDDHLTKPIDRSLLLDKLARYTPAPQPVPEAAPEAAPQVSV